MSDLSEISRLFKIDVEEGAKPLGLFSTWVNDAKEEYNDAMLERTANIATLSKDGTVSSRSVCIREYNDAELIFNTTKRSRKHDDIQNHPQVALCFFWPVTVNGEKRRRQVRIEGVAEEMPEEYARARFRTASMRTKVRYGFCKQGNEIAWEDLKKRHEEYLKQCEAKAYDIDMPDDAIYYKVVAHRVEYYESTVDPITIADRVLFRRNDDTWNFVHLEA